MWFGRKGYILGEEFLQSVFEPGPDIVERRRSVGTDRAFYLVFGPVYTGRQRDS